MTKNELIDRIAEKAEITKKDAGEALNAIVNVIADTLVDGENVQLAGFGTFEVREMAARTGRNPQTGEAIEIPASNKVAFKASKVLKEAVNA